MDWVAQWYRPELVDEDAVKDYEPLAAAEAQLTVVIRNQAVLEAIKVTPAHPNHSMPVMRRLRQAYSQTLKTYARHNDKYERGWYLDQDIDAPLSKLVRAWDVETWLKEDRWAAPIALSTCVSSFNSGGNLVRSMRRDYNSVVTLFAYECERLTWALR